MKNSTNSLSFLQNGTGTPLVLIHAFPLNAKMWSGQLTGLAAISRVICPDLPGFGGSPRMEDPSVTGMAKAVSGLLDKLKIKKPVILCGMSMGGYVALEFVRLYRSRVRALGLFSTKSGADSAEQKPKRAELAGKIRLLGSKVLVEKSIPALLGRSGRRERPGLIKDLERMMNGNSADGIADSLLAMAGRRDQTPFLPKIACPTLILSGDQDEVIPLDVQRAMQGPIPDAAFQIMGCGGHLFNLEQPRRFNDILGRFVRGVIG
jgi:pimeloyl-ACP methyl ester carboxylesterase